MRLESVAAALTLLCGCAHEGALPPVASRGEYRLGREDVIAVEVWKDPALSAKVPVRPDGRITLPMIGEIEAEGRTTEDLRKEITDRLSPMVEHPVVSVMVQEINAARFYVLGEVAHPGAYPVRGRLTLVQALAMAGGPTEFANERRVTLIRPSADGKEQRYRVDARDILSGRAPSLPLYAGDTIFVP
jgi:polysaccharide export outer membrane protein